MRIRSLADGVITPAESVLAALTAQASRTTDLPFLLNYAPVAEMNPFQRLLYCRASDAGFALVPATGFDQVAPVSWAGRSVVHLHWLASVLSGAQTMEEASVRIATFRTRLGMWRAAGHRIVWSMHNVLPHDCAMPEAEVQLREVIVAQADAVHILSKASADEARRYFALPEEKTFHLPHPSYEGWYADVGDRMTARMDLGLAADEFVFVAFGSMQRYKGLNDLVDAFAELKRRHPHRRFQLILAGKVVDKDFHAEIVAKCEAVSGTRVIASAMEERQIQTLMRGADVSVAPYLKTLNSGVALLSSTFRCPLVAPRAGGLAELFAADPHLLYGGGEGDRLVDAMERAMTHVPRQDVFDRILEEHRPERISRMFFDEIRNRFFAGMKGGEG
jgi:beta-1,4-mannosyltransferase